MNKTEAEDCLRYKASQASKRVGDREEGKKGGGLGRKGKGNPLLFIAADAGVRKFLIG